MKTFSASTLLAVSVVLQQASATLPGIGVWPTDPSIKFTSPANNDNSCTDKQKKGYSFDDLALGPINIKYDGIFSFSGFQCQAGLQSRGIGRRTFGVG